MPPQGSGPVQKGQMAIIAGGVGQDVPARVYEEYGQDMTCKARSSGYQGDGGLIYPCPGTEGYPHAGSVCGQFKWSVQFRNDHPTDSSEQKYGLPFNESLVYALQEWRAQKQELRFYWVRYSDTGCKFTDNDVIYCAELVSLTKQESRENGCIRAMHRTFPGLDASWNQGIDYAGNREISSAEATGG